MNRRPLRLVLGLVAAVSMGVVSLGEFDYIAGDPLAFRELTETVVSGSIPYTQARFDHLPVMLVPMLLAWLLGGSASPFAYRAVWVVLSALVLFACHREVEKIDDDLGREGSVTTRWVALVTPLVAIALFRNDLWSVLPALVAVRLAARRPRVAAVASVVGMLAKGWPILTLWAMRKQRWLAAAAAVIGLALLGVIAQLPGFRPEGEPDGLHSETLGGSIYALRELAAGRAPEIFEQGGAIWVASPGLYSAMGLVVAALLLFGLYRSTRRVTSSPDSTLLTIAVLVIAMLVASPVLSTQYLLWPLPFVAVSRRRLAFVAYLASGVLAVWSLAFLELLYEASPVWYSAVGLRIVGLVVTAVVLVRELSTRADAASDPAMVGG